MSHDQIPRNRTSEGVQRMFICLEVPKSIRERIDDLQGRLRNLRGDIGWVKAANIHLTLKFLGDVAPARLDAIRAAVEASAHGVTPFQITVSGTGCFPSPHNPRVLWVGLTEVPRGLKMLHAGIEAHLEQDGFERERKPFSPHLTIGRVRSNRHAQRVVEVLLKEGFAPESFVADEVIVMRSQLTPGGSIYTSLAAIPLPANPSEPRP